ncbi:hypothetical protein BU24DRAFT_85847 [Aaosphaeria arxii CBS 175.79]|uniref:Uncharacterized protein n=1 Tax=Aaosphaeria arxii CBS 175.79 TaxID=1450172 RepID=A0A6A5X886_9PLEO|nr:uncharacterized protein BU24DRAFT_85847 [Aaosphaeria arxii CBS 175.79]KAF2009255.1 hypothetical protein BU24DRAFT_85847 [Aaosphaeria arxii CBS 175.79]
MLWYACISCTLTDCLLFCLFFWNCNTGGGYLAGGRIPRETQWLTCWLFVYFNAFFPPGTSFLLLSSLLFFYPFPLAVERTGTLRVSGCRAWDEWIQGRGVCILPYRQART